MERDGLEKLFVAGFCVGVWHSMLQHGGVHANAGRSRSSWQKENSRQKNRVFVLAGRVGEIVCGWILRGSVAQHAATWWSARQCWAVTLKLAERKLPAKKQGVCACGTGWRNCLWLDSAWECGTACCNMVECTPMLGGHAQAGRKKTPGKKTGCLCLRDGLEKLFVAGFCVGVWHSMLQHGGVHANAGRSRSSWQKENSRQKNRVFVLAGRVGEIVCGWILRGSVAQHAATWWSARQCWAVTLKLAERKLPAKKQGVCACGTGWRNCLWLDSAWECGTACCNMVECTPMLGGHAQAGRKKTPGKKTGCLCLRDGLEKLFVAGFCVGVWHSMLQHGGVHANAGRSRSSWQKENSRQKNRVFVLAGRVGEIVCGWILRGSVAQHAATWWSARQCWAVTLKLAERKLPAKKQGVCACGTGWRNCLWLDSAWECGTACCNMVECTPMLGGHAQAGRKKTPGKKTGCLCLRTGWRNCLWLDSAWECGTACCNMVECTPMLGGHAINSEESSLFRDFRYLSQTSVPSLRMSAPLLEVLISNNLTRPKLLLDFPKNTLLSFR
jgi:hypothetical protein